MFKGLNWVGVAAAFVFTEVFGYVWYGMVFAGKMPMPDAKGFVEGALISLITIIGMAWLVKATGTAGYVAGALFGALVWVFLPFMSELSNMLYAGKSLEGVEMDAAFMLIFLAVSGALTAGLKLGAKPA